MQSYSYAVRFSNLKKFPSIRSCNFFSTGRAARNFGGQWSFWSNVVGDSAAESWSLYAQLGREIGGWKLGRIFNLTQLKTWNREIWRKLSQGLAGLLVGGGLGATAGTISLLGFKPELRTQMIWWKIETHKTPETQTLMKKEKTMQKTKKVKTKEVSSDKNEKVCVVSADYKRPSQLFAGWSKPVLLSLKQHSLLDPLWPLHRWRWALRNLLHFVSLLQPSLLENASIAMNRIWFDRTFRFLKEPMFLGPWHMELARLLKWAQPSEPDAKGWYASRRREHAGHSRTLMLEFSQVIDWNSVHEGNIAFFFALYLHIDLSVFWGGVATLIVFSWVQYFVRVWNLCDKKDTRVTRLGTHVRIPSASRDKLWSQQPKLSRVCIVQHPSTCFESCAAEK